LIRYAIYYVKKLEWTLETLTLFAQSCGSVFVEVVHKDAGVTACLVMPEQSHRLCGQQQLCSDVGTSSSKAWVAM
jgi:hypothetical protein